MEFLWFHLEILIRAATLQHQIVRELQDQLLSAWYQKTSDYHKHLCRVNAVPGFGGVESERWSYVTQVVKQGVKM